MKNLILKQLNDDGFCDLETENDILTIRFRRFFGTEKEFHFELNCKAVFGCKGKKTAEKKIDEFLNKGFEIALN